MIGCFLKEFAAFPRMSGRFWSPAVLTVPALFGVLVPLTKDAAVARSAAGDAGGALGAALATYHLQAGGIWVAPDVIDGMSGGVSRSAIRPTADRGAACRRRRAVCDRQPG
jgi:hypothetical protein